MKVLIIVTPTILRPNLEISAKRRCHELSHVGLCYNLSTKRENVFLNLAVLDMVRFVIGICTSLVNLYPPPIYSQKEELFEFT